MSYLVCTIILYGVGAIVGITGISICPEKPMAITQAGETPTEALSRVDAEYTHTVINSISFKLCMSSIGLFALGIFVNLIRCYTEHRNQVAETRRIHAQRPLPPRIKRVDFIAGTKPEAVAKSEAEKVEHIPARYSRASYPSV